jgi:hypothetical protein
VSSFFRVLIPFAVFPPAIFAQFTTTLSPETDRIFEEYRASAERRMSWTPRFSDPKPNEVSVTTVNRTAAIDIKDGLIHDWAAATFIPGAHVEQVLAVLQNYGEYKKVYAPDVIDSRVIRNEGNRWHAYLKLVKKKAITAILNTEYEIEYRPLEAGRWSMISRSTRISELEGDRELAPGMGHGFLWRLNAYWLIEPRSTGVYLECRTLSLTRDIPAGLGLFIRPFVSSLPRESLHNMLTATARAARS